MKSLLNIRLLILSLTILGSGYLFYSAANCSGSAEQEAPRVMPSVISPFAQPKLVDLVSTREAEEEQAPSVVSTLRGLAEMNVRLY